MASVEAAILFPMLVMLFVLVVGGWRIGWAHTQVREASAAAARAASIARTMQSAQHMAHATVTDDLTTLGIHCHDPVVEVERAEAELGARAAVEVHVECTLHLADVWVPGLPGHLRVSADAREVVDTYSGRDS